MTEVDLLLKAQAGDQDAFDELYRSAFAPVFRFVFSRTRDKDVAEDITQDVFVRFLKAVPTYTPRGSMLSYLLASAHNAVIDWSRKKKPVLDDEMLLTVPSEEATAEEGLQVAGDARVALDALAQLSAGEEEVVRLRCLDGFSTEEVSKLLGKSEEAVRQLLSRGLRHIRTYIESKKDNHD